METELFERSSEEPAARMNNQEAESGEALESAGEIQARLAKEEAARAEITARLDSIQKDSLPVEVKDKLHKLYTDELEGIDQAIKSLREALEK